MASKRNDVLALLTLLGLLAFFFPDLFLVKAAPLIGDSLEQHYPWAFQLAQSLKAFKLPFWTSLIQCGFPLVAESQIGAFYIPNLIFYGLLPFHMAYSYMNLFHWFIAGCGTYAYARQMKLVAIASFVATVVFVFGSAYGGAYYNMTSLKTICWFPVVLYLLERYLEKQKKRFLLGMAIVIGQSLVAGYLQMAVFTWLIFGTYALLRIFIFPENATRGRKKILIVGALTFSMMIALILALPQIFLTVQLAMLSTRVGLEEGFAYVGSLSPLVFFTLVVPKLSLIFRSNNLYSGTFALFLMLFAISSPDIRKRKTFRIWGVMALLTLLLALGRWSPLYVVLIKLAKFYSFRFPAKFIGFVCFSFAMLSAIGVQALWQGRWTQAVVKNAFYAYLAIIGVFITLMLFGSWFFTTGKDIAMKLGTFYVMRYVYTKPGHPHSLETYLERVKNYPDYALKYISLSDSANFWMIVISCFCVVLLTAFLWKKLTARSFLKIGIFFLITDLYAASYLDIQLDLAPYQKVLKPSPLLKILEAEGASGRLARIYGFPSVDKRLPFTPSQNMLYGIEDVGAYSPLVSKRYHESIGLLGNVNDSNYLRFPSLDFALQRLSLLGFLNVSHVLSAKPIKHPDLKLAGQDDQLRCYLYENMGAHRLAYFFSRVEITQEWADLRKKLMAPFFDPKEILFLEKEDIEKIAPFSQGIGMKPVTTYSLEKRREDFEEWKLEVNQAGFFVVSEMFFPGWTATVNGLPVPILRAHGLFRAIRIDGQGRYRIRFQYNPFSMG